MDIQNVLGYGISAFTGRVFDDELDYSYNKTLGKINSVQDINYRIDCLELLFRDIFNHASVTMQSNTSLSNVMILVNTPEFYFRGTFENDFYIAKNLQPSFHPEDPRPKYNARRQTAINITHAISTRFQYVIEIAQQYNAVPPPHVREFGIMVCAGTMPLTRGEKSSKGNYIRMDNFALFFSLHYVFKNGIWICHVGASETAISKRNISQIDYTPSAIPNFSYEPKIYKQLIHLREKIPIAPESLMISYPEFVWPQTMQRPRAPVSVGVSVCIDYYLARIKYELMYKANSSLRNNILFVPSCGFDISLATQNPTQLSYLCDTVYKGGIIIFTDGSHDPNPAMYTLENVAGNVKSIKVQEEIPIFPMSNYDRSNLFAWEEDSLLPKRVARPIQAFFLGRVSLIY